MSDNTTPPKKQTSSIQLKKETVRVTMRATDSDPSLTKHTSLVPLKKETVRVTLKASDASVPSATVPLASPVRPPISPTAPTVGPPRPPAPAPTIALKKGPPTAPTAAPTIPLKTSAPTTATPTIRLATTNSPISTSPVKPPGAPTAAGIAALAPTPTAPGITPSVTPTLPGVAPTLPKATVQLQPPTQPIGTTPPSLTQAATLRVEEEEEDEGAAGTLLKVLSGVGLAAAVALLAFQLMLADVWINVQDNPNAGDWSQLFESNS